MFDNGGCFKSHVQTEIKEGRQKTRQEKRREREEKEKEKAELKALVLRTGSVVKVLQEFC